MDERLVATVRGIGALPDTSVKTPRRAAGQFPLDGISLLLRCRHLANGHLTPRSIYLGYTLRCGWFRQGEKGEEAFDRRLVTLDPYRS